METMVSPESDLQADDLQRTKWIRGLLPFLAAHKLKLFVAFAASLLGMAINSLTPLIQKVIVDNLTKEGAVSNLRIWIFLLVLAGVLGFILSYVRRYWGGRVSLDVQNDLRKAIYSHLQRLDFARHDDMETGQLVSRANSDTSLLQGLLGFLPMMTGNFLSLLVSLVIMFVLSVKLAVVVLFAIPIMFVVSMRLRSSVFPASWVAQQNIGEVASIVDDNVTGVRVVKAFGNESREFSRLRNTALKVFQSRVRVVRLSSKFQSTLQAVPAITQVVVVGFGGYLALKGDITLGTFLAFTNYVLQLIAPVRMLAGLMAFGQQARAGAERILDLLASSPVVQENDHAVDLTHFNSSIEFDSLRFGYVSSKPVLDNFSLKINKGETVALVGTSGSGKSTIALLLPRFYDVQKGSIRIDGCDIRTLTLNSLRRKIGVVFEESFLFSDTVKANIAFGATLASDEDIVKAAKVAEAHDFIMSLPLGYNTIVGEKGLTLSGGQRQRIALARALVGDPEILILDDATSAVDATTEEDIHRTLNKLMSGRTTLLIAHRKSTLKLADRIVIIEQGKVEEEGVEISLSRDSEMFKMLFSSQNDFIIEGELDLDYLRSISTNNDEENLEPTSSVIDTTAWPESFNDGLGAANVPPRQQANLGMGLGGGFQGGGGLGSMLAPTKELLEQVALLKDETSDPNVDIDSESLGSSKFSLSSFLRAFKGGLIIGLSLIVADTLMTLAGPLLIRNVVDAGVIHKSVGAIVGGSTIYLLIAILDYLDTWLELYVVGKTSERILFKLRCYIFSHLSRLGLNFYESEMAGRIMTRMTTDVDALSQLFQGGLVNALVNVFTFLGVGIALFVVNSKLALATFTVVPVLFVATWVFRNYSRRAYRLARERIALVNASLQEGISGIRVTKAFGRENQNNASFASLSENYLEARVGAQRLVAIYFPFVLFISDVATAIVLGYGSHLVGNKQLGIGSLIAFVLLVGQFFNPIQQLSQTFDQWQQAQASMRKIKELMDIQSSEIYKTDAHQVSIDGHVYFQNVDFSYSSSGAKVLSDLNAEILPNQVTAIVGETGAGKSTVMKLLARFYQPSGGKIIVDSVPLEDIEIRSYRSQVAFVPQEPFLFSTTIEANIAYGKQDATKEEIEAAARRVGAHEFIRKLDGGYYRKVGVQGRALSSGQKQLISLARAEIMKPKLLLLDEATSNLDLATEKAVSNAMGLLLRGRTTVIIAHRLQSAMNADRIIVMADGAVKEVGSHDELLALDGEYSRMWESYVATSVSNQKQVRF